MAAISGITCLKCLPQHQYRTIQMTLKLKFAMLKCFVSSSVTFYYQAYCVYVCNHYKYSYLFNHYSVPAIITDFQLLHRSLLTEPPLPPCNLLLPQGCFRHCSLKAYRTVMVTYFRGESISSAQRRWRQFPMSSH